MNEQTNLTIRLPEDKHDELFALAKRTGISASSIVRNLIFKHLAENAPE
jgi:predicted DNA-binding protein